MPSAEGTPITTSHNPAFNEFRRKPRRSAYHVYSRRAPSSRATSSASRFSKPSARSFENGRLLGSAQTRRTRPSAPKHAAAQRSRLRQREDIKHPTLGRLLPQVAH